MANPKYGGAKADFDAAIAATDAKAVEELDRKTKELDGTERENLRTRGSNDKARKASASDIEKQSAALEQTSSRLAAETEAIRANTQAWLANSKAREAAHTAGASGPAAVPAAQGIARETENIVAQQTAAAGLAEATAAQAAQVENLDTKTKALAASQAKVAKPPTTAPAPTAPTPTRTFLEPRNKVAPKPTSEFEILGGYTEASRKPLEPAFTDANGKKLTFDEFARRRREGEQGLNYEPRYQPPKPLYPGAYKTLGERDPSAQLKLYEEALGRQELGGRFIGPPRPKDESLGARQAYETEVKKFTPTLITSEGKEYQGSADAYLKNLGSKHDKAYKAQQAEYKKLDKEGKARWDAELAQVRGEYPILASAADEAAATETPVAASGGSGKRKPPKRKAAAAAPPPPEEPVPPGVKAAESEAAATEATAKHTEATVAQTEATNAQAAATERLAAEEKSLSLTEQVRASFLSPGQRLADRPNVGASRDFGALPPRRQAAPPRFPLEDPAAASFLQGRVGGGGVNLAQAQAEAQAKAAAEAQRLAAAEAAEARSQQIAAEARSLGNARLQQSVAAYASSSQALRRHGALTTEFIQGLVRGEVTLQEFGTQLTLTIGKFAGWAVAGGLVYGAVDAVKHLFTGLKETESGTERLRRALGEKVDAPTAQAGFRRVAQETNSTIKEVSEAQFYSARVFRDQADSIALAGTALRAYRLDQVNTQDAIKAFASINVSFAAGPKEIAEAFDKLDVGQLKFNARLNQTLPQVGRAASSFAAAGGTLKELVDQIIEINRATGGGGGTGGGNPATALLREPANLHRQESEETLRRYEFDPKFAQENVGKFNQQVQERAGGRGGPRLDEKALQQLSIAAGGGPGVGFRYILPLFRLGQTGLPAQIRAATEPQNASGSVKADLAHTLAQADEQVKKLGIDFEVIGSELASIGLGAVLTDSLSGLNAFANVIKALLDPFTKLATVISRVPAPLRIAAESFAALLAVQAAGRSNLGLAARGLASDVIPTYAGGGAREIQQVATAQRKYVEYLGNLSEANSGQQLAAGRKVARASADLERATLPAATVESLDEEQQAAYAERIKALRQRQIAALNAQADTMAEGAAISAEITATEANILGVTKKGSLAERTAFAQEKGLYGAAQGGAPTAGPVLAPSEAEGKRVLAEKQRAEQALYGTSVVPSAKEGVKDAIAAEGEVATATASEARAAEAAAVANSGKFAAATAAVTGLAGSVKGSFTGIKGFIGGLGVLGKGIAAFVALDVANQIAGGDDVLNRAQQSIAELSNPASSAASATDVKSKLDTAKKRLGEGNGVGATLHDIVSGFGLFGETTGSNLLGGGPGTNAKLQKEIDRYEKELKSPKGRANVGALGAGGAIPYAEVAEATEFNSGLEAGQDEKKIEKESNRVAANVKLRLDELKSLGSGKYATQAAQQLSILANPLSELYGATGQSTFFEEATRIGQEVTQGVVSATTAQVQDAIKLGDPAERRAALTKTKALIQSQIKQASVPLTNQRAEIEANDTAVQNTRAQLAKPGADKTKLSKQLENLTRNGRELRSRYDKLRLKYEGEARQYVEAEEAQASEVFQANQGELNARTDLAKAKAGADKQSAVELELKRIIESEGEANKELLGHNRKAELLSIQTKRVQAEEALVSEKISTARAHGAREIAELPLGDTTGKGRSEVETDRHVEQIIRKSKLSPKSKAKQLEEAHTATLTAEKQLEETIASEALALSNLETQLSQARDAGNALAQANDALAGAQRAAGLAKTPQAAKQAQLEIINAQNQIRQALQQRITDEGALLESRTQDPLKQARIKVRTDRKLLAGAQGADEQIKDRTALNNDLHRYTEAQVSAREEQTEFQLKLNKINTDTAIGQYQSLLKIHGLSKKTRQDILLKINALQNELTGGTNGVYDLAPGSIKLPTAYDVHRAISASAKNAYLIHSEGSTNVENNINITIRDAGDVHKVAAALDKALGSGVKARLRAAGLRGS